MNHIVQKLKKQLLEQVSEHGSFAMQLEERMNVSAMSGCMLDSVFFFFFNFILFLNFTILY